MISMTVGELVAKMVRPGDRVTVEVATGQKVRGGTGTVLQGKDGIVFVELEGGGETCQYGDYVIVHGLDMSGIVHVAVIRELDGEPLPEGEGWRPLADAAELATHPGIRRFVERHGGDGEVFFRFGRLPAERQSEIAWDSGPNAMYFLAEPRIRREAR